MTIHRQHVLLIPILTAMILVLSGCGAGSGGESVLLPGTSRTVDGFILEIIDDTYMEGGNAAGFELGTALDGDELVLSISVRGAKNLKALYCGLEYDPGQYSPLSVRATGALSPAGGEVLEPLELLRKDTGRIDCAQLLPWPAEATGFTGDAVLAEVRFRCEPDTWSRGVSEYAGPPTNRRSQSILTWDDGAATLDWFLVMSGDNNRDGYITVADLSDIGTCYRQSTGDGSPFPADVKACIVDYDCNGEVNLYDMQPIWRNYDCRINYYNVYSSTDPADYPAVYTDPDGPGTTLLGTVNFDDGDYLEGFVRRHFSFVVEDPQPGVYYWVRPANYSDLIGTPSTIAGGP